MKQDGTINIIPNDIPSLELRMHSSVLLSCVQEYFANSADLERFELWMRIYGHSLLAWIQTKMSLFVTPKTCYAELEQPFSKWKMHVILKE